MRLNFHVVGSGSVLEALHLRKLLVVVPNASLMDNHQVEVAQALSDQGYLFQSSPKYISFNFMLNLCSDLPKTLAALKDRPQPRPFPASGNKRFAQILDKELGLV